MLLRLGAYHLKRGEVEESIRRLQAAVGKDVKDMLVGVNDESTLSLSLLLLLLLYNDDEDDDDDDDDDDGDDEDDDDDDDDDGGDDDDDDDS